MAGQHMSVPVCLAPIMLLLLLTRKHWRKLQQATTSRRQLTQANSTACQGQLVLSSVAAWFTAQSCTLFSGYLNSVYLVRASCMAMAAAEHAAGV